MGEGYAREGKDGKESERERKRRRGKTSLSPA